MKSRTWKKMAAGVLSMAVTVTAASAAFPWQARAEGENADAKAERTVVSRVVTGENGKSYVEVDGKPFMYENVECMGSWMRRGFDASTIKGFKEEIPLEWMENVFDKTDQAGYNTVSTFFNWNDMEPKEEGVYDWTILDQYIEWAEKYNMRLSLTWFGSDAGGGTRLPGYGAGWSCHVPEYLCDQAKYWNRRGLATEDDKKRESRFRCIPDSEEGRYIKECEKKALIALTEHLRDTDKTHRMISLMINNESQNIPDSWHTELANAVKSVGYDFVIGQHMQKGQYKYREGYDFVGFDDYSTNLEYKLGYLNNSPTPLKACLETGGNANNLSSQVLAGIINGGWIQAWQLCDAYSDCQQLGMFETPDAVYPEMIKPGGGAKPISGQAGQDYDEISKPDYTTWTVGSQETLKYGAQKNRRLQLALRKAYWAVAPAAVEEMVSFNLETDEPAANYSASRGLNGHTFGFVSDGPDSVRKRGSNGMIVSTGETGDEYFCLSDTGTEVTFITDEEPKSATYGHQHGYLPEEEEAGATGEWVKEGDVTVTEQTAEDGTKTWAVKCTPEQVIRLELSHTNAAPVFEQDTVEKISVKNVTVSGTAKATDANTGDTVTYSVKEQPENDAGVVTVKEENGECKWTYVPAKDWYDNETPVTFTIAATDNTGEEGICTVKIMVKGNSSIPVMNPENLPIEIPKNTVTGGKCEATDEDEGDTQTFTAEKIPEHGTLIVTEAGEWTYTPSKDYTGTDSFTIKVTDSYGDTATMTANITVADTEAGTGVNLSRLDGVKAEATSSYAKNPPENAIDGNYSNCWSAASIKNIPVSLTVDLGGIHELSAVKYQVAATTSFEWQYKLEGSRDLSNWDVLTDRQAAGSKTSGNTMVAEQVEGQYRYVRWTVTGTTSVKDAASTREFEIWGSEEEISPDAHEPVIETQPQDAEYTLGGEAAPLTVSAVSDDGGIINYQWYKNTENAIGGSIIPGATEASYIPPTDQEGTAYYYCRVTNHNDHAVGTASVYLDSKIAAVTVKAAVDKTGLQAVYDESAAIERGTYTEESWNALQEALAEAKSALDDENATAEQVETALANLQNAVECLTEIKADKTRLETWINKLEGALNGEQSFTDATKAEAQDALARAKEICQKEDASVEEVDQAWVDLLNAFLNLDNGAERSGLEQAIAVAQGLLENPETAENYTEESVRRVKDALDAAKAVYAKEYGEDVTAEEMQAEINAATNALIDVVTELLEKDYGYLADLIRQAEEMLGKEDKFTPASAENLKKALDAAKKIAGDKTASAEDINAAYDDLYTAMADIQLKGNKAELQSVMEKAAEILKNAKKYHPATLEGLQEAYDAAKEVFDNENAVQSEITDAVIELIKQCMEARILGDVDMNETVGTADSTLVLQYSRKMVSLTDEQVLVGDVDGNGKTDKADAKRILELAAEKINEF